MKPLYTLFLGLFFACMAQSAWAQMPYLENSKWTDDYLAVDFVLEMGPSAPIGVDVSMALDTWSAVYVGVRKLSVNDSFLHRISIPFLYHGGFRAIYPVNSGFGVGVDARVMSGQAANEKDGGGTEATDFVYIRAAGVMEIRGKKAGARIDLGSSFAAYAGDCVDWRRNYYEPGSKCGEAIVGSSLGLIFSIHLK